jgi:hypothetical protein
MLIRCAEIVWDSNMDSIILTGGVSQRIVARICGEVRLVWPKTGFRSRRIPARRKRTVIKRRVVEDADMAELLGTTSVCGVEGVAASGLRHGSGVTVVMARVMA